MHVFSSILHRPRGYARLQSFVKVKGIRFVLNLQDIDVSI